MRDDTIHEGTLTTAALGFEFWSFHDTILALRNMYFTELRQM